MAVRALVQVLVIVALYFGFSAVGSLVMYLRLRGTRLVVCPETKRLALVEVAAGSMAREAMLGDPRYRVAQCSRWPMCRGCGQDCLREVEKHPAGLRLSGAWKAA